MGLPRSTSYDEPTARADDTAIVEAIAAIAARHPPPGCIHHSDRGSQYAAEIYREVLDGAGLIGSMGRRGNPYDNAKAESFFKTLKREEVYLSQYQTFEEADSNSHFDQGANWYSVEALTRAAGS